MVDLDIRLLGPPQVEVAGTPVEVETRKAIAILARLAVDGPQRRETLAALLWPESDTSRARGALRRTLSALKTTVDGSALAIGREEIRLEPGAYHCDVDASRDLVARARAHHDQAADVCKTCVGDLTEAVALHRGDFLSGFSLRDSPDFDDWQFFEAETFRHELVSALDLLVNALAHRGDLENATEHARRRLAIDPLHEPTHRRLMLLHAWTGRREEAIRQYRDCVTTLESELGVAPLEETTSLYQSVLAGRTPPPPSDGRGTAHEIDAAARPAAETGRSQQTEAPTTWPLVGRRDELDVLVEARRSIATDGRLVVVEGEAGIGKTRLLEEFVAHVRRDGAAALTVRCYPGEETLAYAPVADALRAVTSGEVAAAVGRSWLSEIARLVPDLLERDPQLPRPAPLGSPEANRRFFEGVRQALLALSASGGPAVVVIEDMQWADIASQDVVSYFARRLRGAPLCLVLSWRTEAIGRDHPLRHLATGPRNGAGPLHIVLDRLTKTEVEELARATQVEDEPTVDRLYNETEGLPLFAVEYLDALSSGGLRGETWTVPSGVRDLLIQRLAHLSETARQVLTTAAVIGRSFDLEILLHASGRAEEETVAALEELLASDVVTEVAVEATSAHARYDFRHHALRSVTYEEASIARRRLLHARAAESLQRQARASDTPVPLPVVAEHLRLAGRERDAAQTFVRAGDEARALSAHADAVTHYRAALALGHPDDVHLHEVIGDLLTLLGDYRGALNGYQAAAARSAEAGGLATLEHKIAGVHERRGDWPAAQAHLDAAVAALPADADPTIRARLEAESSLAAHRLGAGEEARERAERSLAIAEEHRDSLAVAQAHNILGIIARTEGQLDRAVDYLERSLELSAETADPSPRIAALNNLALTYADRGEVAAGLELGKTALALCRRQGDRHREAAILNNLADLLRAAGQEEEAMRHLKVAVAIFAEVGEPEVHEPEIWKLVDW